MDMKGYEAEWIRRLVYKHRLSLTEIVKYTNNNINTVSTINIVSFSFTRTVGLVSGIRFRYRSGNGHSSLRTELVLDFRSKH